MLATEVARRLADAEAEEDAKELAEAGKDKTAVAAKMKAKDLRAASREIEQIHEGAFAKWYRQPIFIAALAAAAIFGSLELAQPVLSLFFG